MSKYIVRRGDSFALKVKEGMDKINFRALLEIAVIKAELQSSISMVNNINQYQKSQIGDLNK